MRLTTLATLALTACSGPAEPSAPPPQATTDTQPATQALAEALAPSRTGELSDQQIDNALAEALSQGMGIGDEPGIGSPANRPPPLPSKVTYGDLVVTGALDPELARRTVRKYQGQMKYCFESQVRRKADLKKAELTLTATVDADGRVTGVVLDKAPSDAPDFVLCAESGARRWRFEAAAGTVTVPLTAEVLTEAELAPSPRPTP